MSNNSKLLVPMYLEALVLRSDKEDCLDISPQLENYTQSILGDVLNSNIKKTTTLEKGVHLHWTLPKALKHTFVSEGEEMKFPFVPNRWLVVRVQTNGGTTDMKSKIWLVESDTIVKKPAKTNLVIIQDNKIKFKRIGKQSEWPSSPPNPSEAILTAVGAANPFFASFYPGCRNVFGFHDDLSGATDDSTFTYTVTGWYSDPEADPLASLGFTEPINDDQKNQQRTQEWFLQQWKSQIAESPTSTLLHASIHSVRWAFGIQSGVPDGSVQLYAGNTAAESLSAQIRKSSDIKSSEVEELLNALQYQLLEDERNPPTLNSIRQEIQKRSFNPKNRNIIWEVLKEETDDAQLEEQKDKKPNFPDNIELLKELKTLNVSQIKANDIEQKIVSLQEECYFLWYKQASKVVNDYTINGFNYEQARTTVLNQISGSNGWINQLEKETNAINASKTKLNQYPELSGANPEYLLKEKLEDRFWEPNDPVLLLCGSGVGELNKSTFPTDKKETNCRVSDQVFNQLVLQVPNGPNTIPVTIPTTFFKINGFDSLNDASIPFKEIKEQMHETLFLDPSVAVDIALQAYIAAGIGDGKDKTSPVINDYAKKVITVQQELLTTPISPDLTPDQKRPPEPFAIKLWVQAWTPLFMVWEVKYAPNNAQIKNLDIVQDTNNWKLENELFFENQNSTPSFRTNTFQGISPFSNSVFSNIKRILPESLVNKYGELNLIAQSLSGLNKFLLMQKPDIQLPPFKYTPDEDYNFDSSYEIDFDELNIIGPDGYGVGCDPGLINGSEPNLFFPLRSGLLQIENLTIVDSFGQAKKVVIKDDANNPEVSTSFSLSSKALSQKEIIPLPPRIIHPSRLQFNWLNLKEEIIHQDTGRLDNPVFSWLVPNYLDNSIMVYDGDGEEVAILQITNDISHSKGIKLITKPFPGSTETKDLSANPHLEQLLANVNKNENGSIASGIMDLAIKVNLNVQGSQAIQSNSSSMLCGQPIALARCSVGIELLGLPPYNQRWDQSGKQNTGDIETIKVPLFIGDFNHEKDGLLGYFINDDYSKMYKTINAPEFNFSESEAFFQDGSPIKLSPNSTKTTLTLLLDPSAGVHLSSSILPTKFVELFSHHSNDILSTLNISFLVAPFLAEKVEPGIPIPSSMNADWKFTHKSDVQTWDKESDIPEGKDKKLGNFDKQQIYEGWLKLSNLKTNK